MNLNHKFFVLTFLQFLLIFPNAASASETSERLMKQNLDFISSVFESSYAPRGWKASYANWSPVATAEDLKTQITSKTTLKEYQNILAQFFSSTKDYHVGFSFTSTERATLPFTVKKADGEFVMVYIDRAKLPADSFPFLTGDVVTKFDGRDTQEVVTELKNVIGNNILGTDEALATLSLTSRRAGRGFKVPKGSVVIEVESKADGQKRSYQLAWDYTPEKVADLDFTRLQVKPMLSLDNSFKNENEIDLSGLSKKLDRYMISATAKELSEDIVNPYGLGLRNGFLPALGKLIWVSENSKFFQAYVYKNQVGKLIGVVRIASYSPEIDPNNAVEEFVELMSQFEDTTDALVIDQLNNPGGSVFYLYALASTLTEQPLYTPLHRMSLNQSNVQQAQEILDILSKAPVDQVIKAIGGEKKTLQGYPVDYNMIQFVKNSAHFIVSEWEKGKTLSDPYYIFGVDRINPSRLVNYTKPIVILINELDFSGGDFFPSIMQDNKRAKIVGTRTSGAGGYVDIISYPNIFGLTMFSYTGSIAERIDKNPIENLGVTPDVEIPFSIIDLQFGYREYIQKVNAEVDKLLQ